MAKVTSLIQINIGLLFSFEWNIKKLRRRRRKRSEFGFSGRITSRINFVTTVPRFPLNTPSTSVPRERGTVPQPCHAVPIFPPASQDSMISNRPAGNITESFDFSLIETNLRSPIVEGGNKFSTRSDRRFDRSPIPRWKRGSIERRHTVFVRFSRE